MAFTQGEWGTLMANNPPGTQVTDMVSSCQVFGVFVRLDPLPEVPALQEVIPFAVIEADPEHRIESPADYPPIGARAEARILGWFLLPQDVRLTPLNHPDWSHERRLARQDDSGVVIDPDQSENWNP